MNTVFKISFSALALVLGTAGCTTAPYSQPASRPTTRAPVVDRSARQPQTYATQPATPQVEVGQLPEQDPLLPREYSSTYPASAYPAAPYPAAQNPYAAAPRTPPADPNASYGSAPARPYPPATGNAYPPTGNAYPPTGNAYPPAYPPATGNAYQPPAYPPGAAEPYPPAARPYSTPPAEGYARTTPQSQPAYPRSTDDLYGATPPPGSLPEPQPVVPRTPRVAPAQPTPIPTPAPTPVPTPTPAQPTVAMAAPSAASAAPAPTAPAPQSVQPSPRPPADLPPAEITREGNQAVAALLDSADKYVKSNQLDKAGAALERALRIEPRNAGIWHDLAQIRLHQGQYQQAESLASKSNNLASGNGSLQARNWKLIAVARKATGNAAGAGEAEARAAQLAR